eukprot:1509951-Pyramimonas_sp.AAC.1
MHGPWRAAPKLLQRGAANESGQGWAEAARMQGYPLEGCPSLLCGLTVVQRARKIVTRLMFYCS